MTTTYYTPSGNPSAETRGNSSQVRAEFQAIAAAFTSASTDIAAHGLIAGQTWSGTHTFPATTYGVTAAPGASGAAFATLDYVNAVATNAALPGQAGKTDYLLTTNGTVATWGNTINVSVNKFVDGTDKTKKVQIDASGIATGTTRTLAAPNSSGTLALTSDINAVNGSSMVLIGQATVTTAVTNIDFLSVFTATYDKYVVEMEGLTPTGANGGVTIKLANAGVADGSAVYYTYQNYSATVNNVNTLVVIGSSSFSTVASGGFTGTMEVRNANNAVSAKGISIRGMVLGSTWTLVTHEAAYQSANTVTGFRIACSTTTFASGTVRVYGIKNN